MRRVVSGRIVLGAVLAFVYAPIIVLIVYSFNASRFSARWTGFTTQWYTRVFDSQETLSALRNTLLVSGTSTVFATILGTLLAIGLHQYRARARALVELLIYLPVVAPDIVIAVATLAFYVVVGFPLGRSSIILAHIGFQISFVALIVRARLQDFPPAIMEAARDLGANRWETLRFVLFPLIRPGIVAGGLFAFALSIDDFVVTYFTAGAGSSTMSLRIYSMVKRGVTPDVNALSTLLLISTILLLIGAMRKRGGGLVAPLLLLLMVGCSTAEDDSRPGSIEAYGSSVERDSLAAELRLFTWSDYLDPELVEEFESAYGVEVVLDYYDTNEALIAKLEAGGVGQYDVIVASDYAVEVLRGSNLLQPLDHARLPNLENLDPRFRDMPFDPGNQFTVAYQWGTSGLGVRSDLIEFPDTLLDSWGLVFDPAIQAGPFVMMADARETIGAALIYLGHSANTTDPAELAEAEALLIAQRPRALTYAPFANARDLLASGDAVVAHNFSGDILMAQEEVPGIRFVIPREGAILWTDNLAVPTGAPSSYTAGVFINFILDAEVGARLSNFNRYASPNAASLPYIDADLTSDASVYPDSAVMGRLEILRDVGEAMTIYDRIWTRLRAGG